MHNLLFWVGVWLTCEVAAIIFHPSDHSWKAFVYGLCMSWMGFASSAIARFLFPEKRGPEKPCNPPPLPLTLTKERNG